MINSILKFPEKLNAGKLITISLETFSEVSNMYNFYLKDKCA